MVGPAPGIADRGPPGLQLPSSLVMLAPQVISSESSLVTLLLVILLVRVTLVTLRATSIRMLLGGISRHTNAATRYISTDVAGQLTPGIGQRSPLW